MSPDCPAEWAFDVDFDASCDLPTGHPLPHRSAVRGNDGVVALIQWRDGPTFSEPKDGAR